ncbi:hypothetical protein [Varibaculum cambriense]|uniref:hypothetical protein n=1 Tax=Varibaculum cambriense TaxID=184870 RepID=UPI00290F92C9|nr:hypothetical protein [Varibaculum cambriense]MDU3273842.1 hypothetical protein [Varibaculum cambriense]
MSILRKISSFAAATLVAAAPLCIGVCSAPLAQATPSDTPATSTSTTNPAGQTQDLNDWTKKNCPGGSEFVNDIHENTPVYLGYADGKTYLGYTNTTWQSRVDPSNQFIDARTLKTVNKKGEEVTTYKSKFGTCVRVASDNNGQAVAPVYYGTIFTSDESALTSSGFSDKTQTVFQVTEVKNWDPGTKVESWSNQSGGGYQEMPYSQAKNSSDSGFKNLLLSKEDSISLRFSQAGFYTVYLKAITTDPKNPNKPYQAEMAYTFIVGKEASVPKDLQDIVDGKDGEGSDNPPTPDPGETTPDTPDPEPGDEGGGTHPGTDPTPNPGKTTPGTSTPGHGDQGGTSNPGTSPTSKPATGHTGSARNPHPSSSSRLQASSQLGGTNSAGIRDSLSRPRLAQPPANAFPTLPDPAAGSSPAENPAGDNPSSATDKDSNSDSQAASGNPLKFQVDSTSTDLATKQWIRSSSLAVFALGLGAAGITGIGLLIFSRLHP